MRRDDARSSLISAYRFGDFNTTIGIQENGRRFPYGMALHI